MEDVAKGQRPQPSTAGPDLGLTLRPELCQSHAVLFNSFNETRTADFAHQQIICDIFALLY